MFSKTFARNQRGETIMEVLICVGIIGLMMTTAFALSNRNQAYARSSYERGEALSIAETQLERLRNYADVQSIPTKDTAGVGKVFCMNTDTPTYNPTYDILISDAPPANAADDSDMTKYNTKCRDDASPSQFRYAIWPPDPTSSSKASPNTYMITVRWVSPTGNGIDQIEMFYQLYDAKDPAFGALPPVAVCGNRVDDDRDGNRGFPALYLANPDQVDPGCKNFGTGVYDPTKTSEQDPQCGDGVDNADPEDTKADDADPGCGSPYNLYDDDENNPTSIQPINWGFNGDIFDCTAIENYGSSGNGCFDSGGITQASRRNVRYHTTKNMSEIKPGGTAEITIRYQEWNGDGATTTVDTPGYKYEIELKVGSATETLQLPTGNPGVEQTFRKRVIVGDTVNSVSLEWKNNPSFNDPDLQLNYVSIIR